MSSVILPAIAVVASSSIPAAVAALSTRRVDGLIKPRGTKTRPKPDRFSGFRLKKSLVMICAPVSVEELLPTDLSATLRRWFNTMPFQNVPDCVVCEIVAQVGQCSLYPSISPGAILLSHADSQSGDFPISWGPARTPTWTLRILNNQFSVPRQQSFRLGDRCYLPQRLAAKLFSFGRQSPSLVIIKPETSVANLFSKDAILLDQICDDLLLVLGHPAGNRHYDKRKWVQRCAHQPIL
jgi:hypothetical protein